MGGLYTITLCTSIAKGRRMITVQPKSRKYSQQEIDNLEAQGWRWRQSTRWPDNPDAGIWIRRTMQECARHGMTEHSEVLVEAATQRISGENNSVCRECSREVERQRYKGSY